MSSSFFIQKKLFHIIVENYVNISFINQKDIHIYMIRPRVTWNELGKMNVFYTLIK